MNDEEAIAFLACQLRRAGRAGLTEVGRGRPPLAEAFRMVEAGEIRDAISIMALQAVSSLALK